MNWAGKRVAVVGLGKSNLALIRYLIHKGAMVCARDQKTRRDLGATYDELEMLGVDFRLGPDYLEQLGRSDAIFLTPGMRKDLPEIERARARGILITNETNLVFELCRAPIVGITGSSGKTTTTTLVGTLLEAAGYKVYVGGNIGNPLIEVVEEIPEQAVVVLELSSFQLELASMSPRIAVVTNISPNHLDVHDTMDAYIAAKSRILRFQGEEDILVVNRDNEHTVAMAKEARGRVVWFSRQREVADGAFVSGGRIVLSRDTHGGRSLVDVCGVDEIRLLGGHNLENVLAALAVAAQLGATPGTMREVVTSFTGVAHRLELVREHNGIAYFNDSIATSPNRSMAGLAAFDRPVHLIAGGYDKKLPFEELAEVICSRCATLHLIGETRMAIDKAVRDAATRVGKGPQIFHWDSFEEAVKAAAGAARSGDVVLLSPACASYDMFPNFQVRGERFRKLVHQVTEQDLPRVSPL